MSESRDANDPRDLLRAMRKEAEGEFETAETGDTGGQEHATGEDRDGRPAARRPVEAAAVGAGGPHSSGPTGPGPDEPRDEEPRDE